MVKDILDTGMTLNFLKKVILAHEPESFRIVSLLDKPSRRKEPIQADYVGFTIPDEFVVALWAGLCRAASQPSRYPHHSPRALIGECEKQVPFSSMEALLSAVMMNKRWQHQSAKWTFLRV